MLLGGWCGSAKGQVWKDHWQARGCIHVTKTGDWKLHRQDMDVNKLGSGFADPDFSPLQFAVFNQARETDVM